MPKKPKGYADPGLMAAYTGALKNVEVENYCQNPCTLWQGTSSKSKGGPYIRFRRSHFSLRRAAVMVALDTNYYDPNLWCKAFCNPMCVDPTHFKFKLGPKGDFVHDFSWVKKRSKNWPKQHLDRHLQQLLISSPEIFTRKVSVDNRVNINSGRDSINSEQGVRIISPVFNNCVLVFSDASCGDIEKMLKEMNINAESNKTEEANQPQVGD